MTPFRRFLLVLLLVVPVPALGQIEPAGTLHFSQYDQLIQSALAGLIAPCTVSTRTIAALAEAANSSVRQANRASRDR